jgi:copper oxidase (laccase) domain-containing protein
VRCALLASCAFERRDLTLAPRLAVNGWASGARLALDGIGPGNSQVHYEYNNDITAVLGPTIGAASYEVGPEFVARFAEADADYARFFAPSPREAHAMFNLPGFIGMRLQKAGVGAFEDLRLDTYGDPARFFSYRRTTHRKEPDYGRLVSAIALV